MSVLSAFQTWTRADTEAELWTGTISLFVNVVVKPVVSIHTTTAVFPVLTPNIHESEHLTTNCRKSLCVFKKDAILFIAQVKKQMWHLSLFTYSLAVF